MKSTLLTLLLLFTVTVNAQQIISVSPSSGNAGETLDVTITGVNTNFTQASNSYLYIQNYFGQGSGSIVQNSLNVIDDNTMVCNMSIQANAVNGYYDLFFYDYITWQPYGLENGFYINSPNAAQLVSVSPNTGNAGETLDVTITGLNTSFTQASSAYLNISRYFGQGSGSITQNSINVVDDNTMTCNITIENNAIDGLYDFSIYDYIAWQPYGLRDVFTVNSPTSPKIVSVSPTSALAGETLDVTITGSNTMFTQASSSYINFNTYFGQGSGSILQNSINIINDTSIVMNITVNNSAIPGYYDVSTYNLNWQHFGLKDAFYVGPLPPASLVSVTPSSANAGQSLNVTITGQNTHFTQASNTSIEFGFDPLNGVNSFTILNDTVIDVSLTVPTNVYSDFYDVYVGNDVDGDLFLYNYFEVIGNPCSISADYTYTDNGGGNFTFTNNSTGNIVNTNWNFGDGNSVTDFSPNYTFAANGDYVVVLTVTDSLTPNGYCFDYQAQLVQVTGVTNPLVCNAGFSMIPDTNTNSVYVFNSSVGNNLTYFWDFGDGNTSTLQYPSYTYSGPGPFNLCLTVDDGAGCNSTYCDSIGAGGTVVKKVGFSLNVTAPAALGINQISNPSNLITVSPNPGNGVYSIVFEDLQSPLNFNIIDIQGNVVNSGTLYTESTELDITKLASGLYLLRIDNEKPIRLIKK